MTDVELHYFDILRNEMVDRFAEQREDITEIKGDTKQIREQLQMSQTDFAVHKAEVLTSARWVSAFVSFLMSAVSLGITCYFMKGH